MNCLRRCVNVFAQNYVKNNSNQYLSSRLSSSNTKDIKRFYKEVTVTKDNGLYEINLDRKKLRTPLGNIIKICSEPIALGVAEEWRCQGDVINKHDMHLTSLTNKCIDRKDYMERETIINNMLEYFHTDTVCFRAEEPQELVQLQIEKWDPLLDWMEKRFDIKIPVTFGLSVPIVPVETRETLVLYLKSFPDWALVGYEQAVECLKSFVIGSAVVNRKVDIDEAVRLSSLELEFQTNAWGTVEWKHTIDEYETKTRLAAAMLFVYLNTSHYSVTRKAEIK